MRRETLELLEFPKLLEIISGMTQSAGGRSFLRGLQPLTDSSAILERRRRISETLLLQEEGKSVSLLLEGEPEATLTELEWEGRVLKPQDFLLLREYLQAGQSLLTLLVPSEYEALKGDWLGIPPLRHLLQALTRTFDEEGEIKDSAHPELADTRRRKREARRKVQSHLEGLLKKHAKVLIPEAFVTRRNHRYVIPVRVEHQKSVPGVMHAASASGATVFIEPFSVVDLNNSCLYLDDREREIIQQILTQLSQLFRAELAGLRMLLERLAEFDAWQAISRYSKKFKCVLGDFSEEGRLELRQARHPLLVESLGADSVVPLDIKLPAEQRLLVISGPNTGGKTVALKTIGLLALAAHASLPVPAEEAIFPRFRQVQADIGDHQSIAENLSTFSAHIFRIRQILGDLELPCLILLDEIGAGTDPVYGGALAVAIVDCFRRERATLVATTHLRSVKAFAADCPDVLNASVGLDPTTLHPTYELELGSSGESSALEIAAQLGLPGELVERARDLLSEQEQQLESYLAELNQSKKRLEEEQARVGEQQRDLEQAKAELGAELARERVKLEKQFEKRLEKVEDEYKRDVTRFLKSTQDRMQAAQVRRQAAKRREALRQRARESLREEPEAPPVSACTLESGQEVFHRLFRKRGKVLESKGDQAIVEIEGKRVTAPISQLARIEQREVTRKPTKRVMIQVIEDTEPELNLVGRRVDEAMDLLDKFLDRAFLSELQEVRIIHGFGTGRLKEAVHEMLLKHPHVAKHELEGGATIAQLRI